MSSVSNLSCTRVTLEELDFTGSFAGKLGWIDLLFFCHLHL